MKKKRNTPDDIKEHQLEDYEPGASREEVFKALGKAIQTPKKPSSLLDQASSKT
jgi:hypothetical protein